MLPFGWQPKKLDELGFVGRGKSRHRPRNEPSLYGGDYPFIQTADIVASECYITNFSQTYSEKGLAQSKQWEAGTLCIVIAGENTGQSAILKFRSCFPDSVVGFIADAQSSDVHYVKYYLDTITAQIKSVTKGATQDNLSLSKLLSFDIPTPPIEIQRKIAAILSAYDELIENSTRRIKLLEQAAHDLYHEWFVEFRFPGHKNIEMVDSAMGPIPQGWEVKTVADLGHVVTGKTPSKLIPENFGNYMPFIKTPDMHNSIFILDTQDALSDIGVETQLTKTIPENSICVSCIGTIGVVSITSRPSQTNQQINSVILDNPIFRAFAYYAIVGLRDLMINYASTGATMANLSKGKFESLNVTIPDVSVLSRFHDFTFPMFEEIKTLLLRNSNLRQTRDLLLPRLVSGEVDVSELEIGGTE
jgi:type I restriction enzyme, S subunit